MALENRSLNGELIRNSLISAGMNQKDLAEQIGVSAQSVTNWLSGNGFPRPAKLLKLGLLLNLTADQLVLRDQSVRPQVAFRKKAGSKTTIERIQHAEHVGMLLRPMVKYFDSQIHIRPSFRSSHVDTRAIAEAALQTRTQLGKGEKANIKYDDLIAEFSCCGTALIPVMWGDKEKHKNGLHIHLPKDDFTFIFLNLDTRVEDFKFWMAHELAHVYTPDLAGTNEGEDFADAFAGSLLFSSAMAKVAYEKILVGSSAGAQISILVGIADKHRISALTVFNQVKLYAQNNKLTPLKLNDKTVNRARNKKDGKWVSELLFGQSAPSAEKYVKKCREKFNTEFFDAFKKMSAERDVGAGYLQQVLSVTHVEAKELHQVLTDENASSS